MKLPLFRLFQGKHREELSLYRYALPRMAALQRATFWCNTRVGMLNNGEYGDTITDE